MSDQSPDFITEELTRQQIGSVYPLIREAVPTIDLPSWLRFAQQLTASRRGGQCGIIVVRRGGREFPSGLFCYRVEGDLQLGKVLIAEYFVAIDLLDSGAVLAALVEGLDALAKRLECGAVRSVVHGGASEIEDGLHAAGHRPEGALLLKRFLHASRGPRGFHEPPVNPVTAS